MRLDIILQRNYYPGGTNGACYSAGKLICRTIELPWLNNETGKSCIKEGVYKIEKRSSDKFGEHMILKNVPGRELILIHPANDALKELRGCIAPVTTLTGEGKGSGSRAKFEPLKRLVYDAINKGNSVYITIQKTPAL